MSNFRIAVVALVLLIPGCGPSDEKIPLEGVVLSDGKPLSGASIAFIGKGGGAYSSATSDQNGLFKIRVVAGKNQVAVNKVSTEKAPPVNPNADQTMPTEAEYTKVMKSAPKALVAERFSDPDKSGIVIDVVKGMSSVDINVMSK